MRRPGESSGSGGDHKLGSRAGERSDSKRVSAESQSASKRDVKSSARAPQSQHASSAKISPARVEALQILLAVAEGRGHSDELLHSATLARLSPEDRNLATALVMGVLRWQIALDAEIAPCLARQGQRLAEPVAIALRMGLFQLRHTDRIPAHAALSESVELCRAFGQSHAAGMVNAVLRRLTTVPKRGTPVFESPDRFAERLGHPRWLVERWVAQYGRAATLAICEYDQQEPGRGGLFSEPAESNESLPEIDDGSRLVAELAAISAPPGSGEQVRVWDCCAAPGGKTLVLATRLPHADVLATDISSRRLESMRRRFSGVAGARSIRTELVDASAPPASLGLFDLVLCDVPCSGTGTLARNPEIRLRLELKDLARQADRQRAILRSAARHLKPGGRLVYSTCSLEPQENEAVVDCLQGELRQVPVEGLAEQLRSRGILPESGWERVRSRGVRSEVLRILPGSVPCDGFFAAVLERVASR